MTIIDKDPHHETFMDHLILTENLIINLKFLANLAPQPSLLMHHPIGATNEKVRTPNRTGTCAERPNSSQYGEEEALGHIGEYHLADTGIGVTVIGHGGRKSDGLIAVMIRGLKGGLMVDMTSEE
jgi:hypothetical protein